MGGDEAHITDLGVVTTPCLHYVVKGSNLKEAERAAYGEPTAKGYLATLSDAFNSLMVCTSIQKDRAFNSGVDPVRLCGCDD